MNNTETKVVSVDVTNVTLRGIYNSSTDDSYIADIASCIQVTLQMRSIAGVDDNPLEPLLEKKWPPIRTADKKKLIIPEQNKRLSSKMPQLQVTPVKEMLSFQLTGLGNFFGDGLDLEDSFKKQLSTILNLSTTCFDKPLLKRDDYFNFYCNISSVCDDRTVSISDATATFRRLLNDNQLIMHDLNGNMFVARSLKVGVVSVDLLIFTKQRPNMDVIEELLKNDFDDLSIKATSWPEKSMAISKNLFTANILWKWTLMGLFSCQDLNKLTPLYNIKLNSTQVGLDSDWLTMTLVQGQNIPCELDYSPESPQLYPAISPSTNYPKKTRPF